MVRHRFFAPGVSLAADAAAASSAGGHAFALSDQEADHLRRVLRLRAGDEIGVFDGEGREFVARVASVDRGGVRVSLVAPAAPARELATRITLAQCALKGDKLDEVVRDAVMMGAAAVQPLASARTEVPLEALAHRVDRWARIAVASTKQCGRAYLARIDPPRSLDEWLRLPGGSVRLMLVEPAIAGARPLREVLASPPDSASVLVGPEGGWAREEIDLAVRAGRTIVTLGSRTLRADAVALVALANLQFAWESGSRTQGR